MSENITNLMKIEKRKADSDSRAYAIAKKIDKNLRPLRFLALGTLIMLPIFTEPSWCEGLKNRSDSPDRCYSNIYVNSGIPKVSNNISGSLYMAASIVLSFFLILRLFLKKRTKSAICRLIMLIVTITMITYTSLMISGKI